MATYTTNYNLAKPEGTDAYNHLIYDNPNMDTIDTALKSINDLTVSRATCVKTGTNHAVTRLNTDAVVFRFTATGDFNTGDTMTVDGVSVSVFLPNGEAAATGAYIINSEVLAAIQGTRVTLFTNAINQIDADRVVYDNTSSGLNAINVQDAIDEACSIEDVSNKITVNTTYFGKGNYFNAVRVGKYVFLSMELTVKQLNVAGINPVFTCDNDIIPVAGSRLIGHSQYEKLRIVCDANVPTGFRSINANSQAHYIDEGYWFNSFWQIA